MPRLAPKPPDPLLAAALSASLGAALLLDAQLKIALVTEEARALLGVEVALGALAAKVLCAKSPARPVAEALAKGVPVHAVVAHPADEAAGRLLEIRAIPLVQGGDRLGWLLLLDSAGAPSEGPSCFHGMWTQSPKMKEVFRIIERVAGDDASVLLRGETGTGKELAARALHALSSRASGPFRAINCAALPATLLESELFGHVRGAFTGAVSDTKGHFQLAHRGTLFLDEVGEMPPELQAKLLRVLETRSVLPVGGRQPISVDVRIVSATHRALRQEVEAGRFRADLMYRLRVIPIFLPALRDRREDISLLIDKFIESMNPTSRRRIERWRRASSACSSGKTGRATSVSSGTCWPMPTPWATAPSCSPAISRLSCSTWRSRERPRQGKRAPSRRSPRRRRRCSMPCVEPAATRLAPPNLLGMSRVTLWRRMQELGIASERLAGSTKR